MTLVDDATFYLHCQAIPLYRRGETSRVFYVNVTFDNGLNKLEQLYAHDQPYSGKFSRVHIFAGSSMEPPADIFAFFYFAHAPNVRPRPNFSRAKRAHVFVAALLLTASLASLIVEDVSFVESILGSGSESAAGLK